MADTTEVVLARIEVKLDQLIRQGTDHESRVRTLEGRTYISPRLMWLASSFSAAVGSAATLILKSTGKA